MPSYLVDAILLAALVFTTIRVGAMYRELRRLRSHHEDYRKVFAETGAALAGVERALGEFSGEGREVLASLEQRISEARRLAGALRETESRHDQAEPASAFEPLALAATLGRA